MLIFKWYTIWQLNILTLTHRNLIVVCFVLGYECDGNSHSFRLSDDAGNITLHITLAPGTSLPVTCKIDWKDGLPISNHTVNDTDSSTGRGSLNVTHPFFEVSRTLTTWTVLSINLVPDCLLNTQLSCSNAYRHLSVADCECH